MLRGRSTGHESPAVCAAPDETNAKTSALGDIMRASPISSTPLLTALHVARSGAFPLLHGHHSTAAYGTSTWRRSGVYDSPEHVFATSRPLPSKQKPDPATMIKRYGSLLQDHQLGRYTSEGYLR